MKFSTLLISATVATLAQASPATEQVVAKRSADNVQWWIKTYEGGLDKNAMHDCLNHFNTNSFQNQYWCGGMYWQMGSRLYNSA
ncbi:hypothetical protein BDN72DRAFT_850397, partial [Pluteus cervinus]